MGHRDITVRGATGAAELKSVLLDTGATYTVLPARLIAEIGAVELPTSVSVELADGKMAKASVYAVSITMEEAEAPAIVVTFDGAQPLVGVQTLESIGVKVDPTTGQLELTRPKGVAYAMSAAPAGEERAGGPA